MEKEMRDNYSLPKNVYVVPLGESTCYSANLQIIGKADEGWSSPDYVLLSYNGKTITGYLKLYEKLGEKNEIEIVLNQIGCIIEVSLAETVVAYLDAECTVQLGIISVSVVQHSQERFVCFREMRDELYLKLINGEIGRTPWIDRWMRIRGRKAFLPPDTWEITADGLQEYFDTLCFAEEILALFAPIHQVKLVEFGKSYLEMLVFDLLVGQADRSPSNYGCIINSEDKELRFSPLFDNSTLSKPFIPKSCISLNHMLMDRAITAEVCRKKFGAQFEKCCNTILKKRKKIIWMIEKSQYISNERTRNELYLKIQGGINILGNYY